MNEDWWGGGMARCVHGGEEKWIHRCLVGKSEGRRPLQSLGIVGSIMLTWLLGNMIGRHELHLAQDRDKWQAVMHMVLNIWVPQNVGNFVTNWGTSRISGRNVLYGINCRRLVFTDSLEGTLQSEACMDREHGVFLTLQYTVSLFGGSPPHTNEAKLGDI